MKKVFFLFLLALTSLSHAGGNPLSDERQDELTHLLLHDCGSCHGMTLKGGLGPALTPEALVNKPEDYLIYVISNGRPNTPMPPWKPILSDRDIQWLVSTLKEGLVRE